MALMMVLRHAADMSPLEGLRILRCAIHDSRVAHLKDEICENEGSKIEFRGWMS